MRILLLLLFVFGLSGNLLADTLPIQLQIFIDSQPASQANQTKTTISIITPANRWPPCASPQFSLPANGRYRGNITISAYCGQQRYFLQAQVQMIGHYLIAARQINKGSTLTAADIQKKTGRLDRLPPQTLTNDTEAIGAITLRNISSGQPINLAMLRRSWVIEAGQTVQVVVQGQGFTIKNSGKALSNAAAEDNVRVRLLSGQVINGIANRDGYVVLVLEAK